MSKEIYNDNLEDITKQFNMDKKEGSQFFIEQVGLDEIKKHKIGMNGIKLLTK